MFAKKTSGYCLHFQIRKNSNAKTNEIYARTPELTRERIVRSLIAIDTPDFILIRFLSRHFMAYLKHSIVIKAYKYCFAV